MAKHLSDFRERCASSHHRRGQAVAKQVRATPNRREAGTRECSHDDSRHSGRMREAAMRRFPAKEDVSRGAWRPALLEIESYCFAHVGQQRQAIMDPTFASDDDLSFTPSQVVQLQCLLPR